MELKKIIKDNRYFFICFVALLLAGSIGLFFLKQGDLIWYFSDNRSPFGDIFFTYATRLGEPIMYAVFFFIVFIKYKHQAWWLPIIGVVVTIVSFGLKSYFLHLRPVTHFKKAGLFDQLHLVEGIKTFVGETSFPSGHSMSAFALYTFLALLFSNKKSVAISLLLLAALTGISRIYLVQHFLKDVYLGAVLGVIIAVILYGLQQKYKDTISNKIAGLIKR